MDIQEIARGLIVNYFNDRVDKSDPPNPLQGEDVYVVWFSKTLENWKALLSTTVQDGMYYEVTHSGNAHETYIDVYKKFDNVAVLDEQLP